MLYYFSILFLLNVLIPKEVFDIQYFKYLSFFLFFYIIIHGYFLMVHKEKYKRILKRSDSENKSSLGAILFPLIAFILFNVGWILKMLSQIS